MWFGVVGFSKVWSEVRLDEVRWGMVVSGTVWFGEVVYGKVRYGQRSGWVRWGKVWSGLVIGA